MKQSWKSQPAPETALCDCLNPAPASAVPRCARCREMERNPVMQERCGFSRIWDIPRSTLIEVRRACDAWLRSRGLNTETGHSYLSE